MTIKVSLPVDLFEYVEAKAAAEKISVSKYLENLFLRERRLTPHKKEAKNGSR